MWQRVRDIVRRNVGGKSLQWWLQSYAIFAGSFASGIMDNSKILVLPMARAHYDISYTFFGALQALILVSYVLGSSMSSFLLEKFGYKKTFVAAYVIPVIALTMMLVGDNKVLYMAGQILMGAGMGSIDNIYSSFSTIFYLENTGFWLTFYGAFYGLGGFASVPIATSLMKALSSLNFHAPNIGFMVVMAVCAGPLLFTHFPSAEEVLAMQAAAGVHASLLSPEEKKKALESSSDAVVEIPEEPVAKMTTLECLKTPKVWFLGMIMCSVLLVERAGLTWGGVYIRDFLKLDIEKEGALFSSVFLILYTVARVTNGFFLDCLGCYTTLYVFLGLGAEILLAGLLNPSMLGVYILMLNGFMVSIYFPAVLLMVTIVFGPNADTATSVFVPIQSSMLAVSQLLLGMMSDKIGSAWAFRGTLAFAGISLVLVFIAQRWVLRSHNMHPHERFSVASAPMLFAVK